MTDNGGKTATATLPVTVNAGGVVELRRRRARHRRAAALLAPGREPRVRRSPTPRARPRRPAPAASPAASPAALRSTRTPPCASTASTASARSRLLDLVRHEQADDRVLAQLERLRQRRRAGVRVHPELQRQRRRVPGRPGRAPVRRHASASRIGRGGSRNNVFFARPAAGSWHHYAIVHRHLRAGGHADHPLHGRRSGALHEDRERHGRRQLRQLRASTSCRAPGADLFGGGDLDEVAMYDRAAERGDDLRALQSSYGTNRRPVAALQRHAEPGRRSAQTVTFNGAASSDPDGIDHQVRVGPRRQRHLRDRHAARPPTVHAQLRVRAEHRRQAAGHRQPLRHRHRDP